MNDNEHILENFWLEDTIQGPRNENFNYITVKAGVNLDMIKFKDKIVITIFHGVQYCVVLLYVA